MEPDKKAIKALKNTFTSSSAFFFRFPFGIGLGPSVAFYNSFHVPLAHPTP
jgi:hypothetical protein